MIYGSVCSGIEAATQAWHPLGWTPAFFSEIDNFPAAVLAHHYGSNMPGKPLTANGVPNLGDMTKFKEWPDYAIDLLVGGTPCQDYSIAGQRLGMAGSRGQLTLTYIQIAARYRPRWVVWENVPGVLSSNDGRDFARFLGDLSGQSIAVPNGGWQNSGIVSGDPNAYGLAYRVLDAQFVRTCRHRGAVPQRRRRVFVVGHLGDWRRAAAVLFDRESLSGNPPPRREAGQDAAPTLAARTRGGGGLGTDFDLDGGLIASTGDVAHCLNAGGMGRIDYETETMVAHALRGDGSVYEEDDIAAPLTTATDLNAQVLAFSAKDYGGDAMENVSPTLRADGHSGSHANAGVMPAIAIQERSVSENPDSGPQGAGYREDGVSYTIEARHHVQAVAFAKDQRGEVWTSDASPQLTCDGGKPGEGYHAAMANLVVRRLTPTECHRLQGFPDGFCNIPWRGKDHAPDGPQYKALGNSMAVNVMEWIGRRIAMVDALP